MSARDVSPFVGWHCSGAFGHVRCREVCAWCRDEAAKNDAALSAAGWVVVPRDVVLTAHDFLVTVQEHPLVQGRHPNVLQAYYDTINALRTAAAPEARDDA